MTEREAWEFDPELARAAMERQLVQMVRLVDDLLDAWQAEYLPEAKGLRLVGHQWSPQSHTIKDFLASNLIPYHWLDIERDPAPQGLGDERFDIVVAANGGCWPIAPVDEPGLNGRFRACARSRRCNQ